jgi:NADPH:quinone reductase-like Zn-dependent oxidoreductase
MASTKTMRAVHISSFVTALSAIEVSQIPCPSITDSTLLIRVTHVSPTHVDILYAQGKHQNNQRHAKPPFILGMDFAGIVEHSPTSSQLKAGDNVYGSYFGAFAEYIAIDVKGGAGSVRRVPKKWTNAEACAVGASGAISLGCFYRAGKIQRGDWILVTGASGGLGVIAVQVAKALGAKVIALVGNEEKGNMLKGVGVDACVSYKEKGWETKVQEISDGGVSVVYDAVGMVESSLRCCRFGGTVVIVGFAGRGGDMEKLKVNRILLKGAGVAGYVSDIESSFSMNSAKSSYRGLANMVDECHPKRQRFGQILTKW